MRFDEILKSMFEDYKAFNEKADVMRAEGKSDAEISATIDHEHPAYPTDPTEAVWRELSALAVTAFVSSGTQDLLEKYLEV